jgi:hypothetical protein
LRDLAREYKETAREYISPEESTANKAKIIQKAKYIL